MDRHEISFDLRQKGDWTIVLFKHQGWKEPVEFMHHCSTKWGVFLLSLKSLLETGKGAPHPNEIKLDSWELAEATGPIARRRQLLRQDRLFQCVSRRPRPG
jgi:hypothetical protein